LISEEVILGSDVPLEGEGSHINEMSKKVDYWQDNGFAVLGKSRGRDILLWVGADIIRSGEPYGQWIAKEASVHHTCLIMLPYKDRGKMVDNDFIDTGWYAPTQYLNAADLKITENRDATIWKLQDREYISRPPYWEIKGSHAGVGCNLVLTGLGPAWWMLGAWNDLPKRGYGGYEQICTVSGNIEVGNNVYELSEGYAMREALVYGQKWDIMPELTKGMISTLFGCSRDVQFLAFIHHGRGFARGRVQVRGQVMYYEGSEVTLDTLEHWVDPRTGINIPGKWHLRLASPEGVLDLDIVLSGRAIWHWILSRGIAIHYLMLLVANGKLRLPHRRSTSIRDMRVWGEWSRPILILSPVAQEPV